ncbi:MAG TPA: type II secretion system F family protein [Blastocatellia bacterium]|nr:type II secretion system F family protein [Blastocatellia bacterium]
MDFNSLMFFGSVAFAVGSGVFALYWYWVRPANPVENRLREINPRVAEEAQAQPVSTILVEQVAKRLDQFTPTPSPRNVRRLRRRLIQAGYYDENAVTVFRVIRLISVMALPVGTIFLTTVILRWPFDTTVIGLTLVSVIYGLFLPSFTLSRMISNRQARITHALPDALDLMVVCVEAGLGMNAALQRVGREMEIVERDLSSELAVTNREIRAGKPRDEALRNLGDRTGVGDVKSLVAMLVQTDRFGTSIADSLRVFADSMRTKRRQRAEELVAKAAIKLIFPLLLFIFPALLIVLMGPALIKLSDLFNAMGQQ